MIKKKLFHPAHMCVRPNSSGNMRKSSSDLTTSTKNFKPQEIWNNIYRKENLFTSLMQDKKVK